MNAMSLATYLEQKFAERDIVDICNASGYTVFQLFKPKKSSSIVKITFSSYYDKQKHRDIFNGMFKKEFLASYLAISNFIIAFFKKDNIKFDRLVRTKENKNLEWVSDMCKFEANCNRKDFFGIEHIEHIEDNPSYNCTDELEFSVIAQLLTGKILVNAFIGKKHVQQLYSHGFKGKPSEIPITRLVNTAIDYLAYNSSVPTGYKTFEIMFGCNNCSEGIKIPVYLYENKDNIKYTNFNDLISEIIDTILPKAQALIPKFHQCANETDSEEIGFELGIHSFRCIKRGEEVKQIYPNKECNTFEIGEPCNITIDPDGVKLESSFKM
jgi:hypothetical protein